MKRKSKPTYWIDTWDAEKQKFTPQQGVRGGPYSLFGLRKAIRALRRCGYDGGRQDPSIYVSRKD